jgi:histone deacetylase 11
MTRPTIHYSPDYNLDLMGLEALHPFDTQRAGKALELVRARLGGEAVARFVVPVVSGATTASLGLAHSSDYLASLTNSRNVATALQLPELEAVPAEVLERRILRPIRLAVQGSIDAARAALTGAIAVNLAGGFHHATYDEGGGFCLYGDVVIALRSLYWDGRLDGKATVLYVDLDAHQGNGVSRLCQYYGLDQVAIFDMYNRDVFPDDRGAINRVNYLFPLAAGTGDVKYLGTLKSELPVAIEHANPALVIYNAGTDILSGDPLGDLGVSEAGVIERDRYVIDACRNAGIPLLIVPSGGYTRHSHRLVAEMLHYVLSPAANGGAIE